MKKKPTAFFPRLFISAVHYCPKGNPVMRSDYVFKMVLFRIIMPFFVLLLLAHGRVTAADVVVACRYALNLRCWKMCTTNSFIFQSSQPHFNYYLLFLLPIFWLAPLIAVNYNIFCLINIFVFVVVAVVVDGKSDGIKAVSAQHITTIVPTAVIKYI